MTCKDCIHSGLCYKENDYDNFPDRCGRFISYKVLEERPQGEWLEMKREIDDRHSVFIFKCPFCGYIEKCKANFCGKCGAEMKMRTTAD